MLTSPPSRLRSVLFGKLAPPPMQMIWLYYKSTIFEEHSFFALLEICDRMQCMLEAGIYLNIAVCGRHLLD